jgi:hypothetical protein
VTTWCRFASFFVIFCPIIFVPFRQKSWSCRSGGSFTQQITRSGWLKTPSSKR